MKNEVKNSPFNAILVAVCVFVGVGFISGAEIWFYFARFGKHMVFGIITFAILSFLLVYYSMSEEKNYPKSLRKFKLCVLLIGELLIGSAMVSGLVQTSRQLFGEIWLLVFAVAILVMILVFCRGLKSTIIYNYFVATFIIFIIICLFCFNNNICKVNSQNLSEKFSLKSAFLSSIFACIYIFMNISEIRPITENYQHKNKFLFSLIFASVLIFLVFVLSFFLNNHNDLVENPMPFLLLFNSKNIIVKSVFMIGLIMAMISTAIACLEGAKNKLNLYQKDENFNKIFVILTLLIFGQLPFLFFIKIVYPLVGIFNFLVFVIEIIYSKKKL